MDAPDRDCRDFSLIRARLDEIALQVRDEGLALDAALDLYDEAVKLGMKATELLEVVEQRDRTKSRFEPMSDDEEVC